MKKIYKTSVAVFMALWLAFSGAFGVSARGTVPFNDVRTQDWFYDAVGWAFSNGIVNGVSSTEFAPNGYMTRAMLVTVLWRYAGMPSAGAVTFNDVASNRWYSQAIAWATESGIVMGHNPTTFGTNDFITREQMYTVLYRFMQFADVSIQPYTNTPLQQFADTDGISSWANEAMYFMFDAGVMFTHGTQEHYARPQENATRSEIVGALYSFNNHIVSGRSDTPVDFYARRHRTGIYSWDFEGMSLPSHPFVIRSMNQLALYMEYFNWMEYGTFGAPWHFANLIQVFDSYADDFFVEHMLVVLHFEESSGSNQHTVSSVLENGDIHLVRTEAFIGTADMASWHIVIELERSIFPQQFNLIVENARCPLWYEFMQEYYSS